MADGRRALANQQHVNPNASWAQALRPMVAGAQRPLKVLSPCAGLNTGERAAAELAFPWETNGDWEVNSSLHAALALLSSDPCKAHVGIHAGDVQAV